MLVAFALLLLPAIQAEAGAGPAGRGNPVRGAVWPVVTQESLPLRSSAVVAFQDDLYFLSPDALWLVADGKKLLSRPQALVARRIAPAGRKIGGVPMQEFSAMTVSQARQSIAILDKSGDIFEYLPSSSSWRALRANRPITGQPDPEYVDIVSMGARVFLLDPERNQIWRFPGGASTARLLPEILPWRLKPGDTSVADGVALATDGKILYVLRKNGRIARLVQKQVVAEASPSAASAAPHALAHAAPHAAPHAVPAAVPAAVPPASPGPAAPAPPARTTKTVALACHFRLPEGMRPSRLYTGPGLPLFVVERENNRVLMIDPKSGRSRRFQFGPAADLRGLLPYPSGFYVIDGANLERRAFADADSRALPVSRRRIDSRLDGLSLPLAGVRLPRHPGVWPGARRLYRYGVHKGVDFFADSGCAGRVVMDSPVLAAESGRVLRADRNFRDMDAGTFAAVMRQCRVEHITSERNEDLFRGCQVWIDHGGGLVTKYAHLNSVNDRLAPGVFVNRGDIIGYVGVSGTGQNLPGRVKHPHLHFEIWLDDNYLGFGLTPAETIGVLEDIFGTTCQ